jgi:poly(A) polymerase
MYKPEWSDAAIRRLMYDLGEDFEAEVEVAKADVKASNALPGDNFPARLADLLERVKAVGEAAKLAKMRPLLNGEEVMELLEIPPGPQVGKVHEFLLSEQIEGNITTKEEATQAVKENFSRPAK